MKNEFKNGFKKEAIMFISLTLVSVLIAFNLKSFVRTGGLFPGGFSGLTILQYAKMKEIYPKWQTTNGVDLIDAISFNRELDNPHPASWIGQLQINRFRGREKCSILVETVE